LRTCSNKKTRWSKVKKLRKLTESLTQIENNELSVELVTVNPRNKVEKFIPISGRRKTSSTYTRTLNKYKIFGPNNLHDENGHTN